MQDDRLLREQAGGQQGQGGVFVARGAHSALQWAAPFYNKLFQNGLVKNAHDRTTLLKFLAFLKRLAFGAALVQAIVTQGAEFSAKRLSDEIIKMDMQKRYRTTLKFTTLNKSSGLKSSFWQGIWLFFEGRDKL
jgi:hypothetical protein